jgi:CAI-1 autoinducer synthase
MNDLKARIDKYYATRTKQKGGILKDYFIIRGKQHSIFLHDNDYLGLTNDSDILRAQVSDLQQAYGISSMKSSMFLTDSDPHFQLEQEMGKWFGKQCILTQSGYAANVGLMHGICQPGTPVYVDQFLHASFYDGLAARRAKVHLNKPNDSAELEANIIKHGPGIILIESVYSTTGDFAPIEEIIRIKQEHACILVVDESHSLGLYGPIGLLHSKGLQNHVDYVTASLSKAYCTRAGIIFATDITFVKENSFHYIFSSALGRNDIVRIKAMWEIIKAADHRRTKLHQISHHMRQELSKVADLVNIHSNLPSAIITLRARDEEEMARLHQHLSAKGILSSPFCYPATSLKHPIVRLTLNHNVSVEDVQTVVRALVGFQTQSARL